jgi:hypothetical protein
MNNKTTNPFLKSLISEIANKTNQGRMDVNWSMLTEAKKKKTLKREVDEKKKKQPLLEPEPTDETPAPTDGPTDEPKNQPSPIADTPPASGVGQEDAASPQSQPGAEPETPEAAQADATQAKADLEKAKAEKDQAEEELKDQSYVKLSSSGGTQFLLSKLLGHAFKSNTIDALAGEMVDKLKIQTQEDFSSFSEEVAQFMVIPGMAELLSTMKGLATQQPKVADKSA